VAGRPFRVVLLDGMMPDMDGYAVAERISANPRLAGPIIVMLTSNDATGEVARCGALGISTRLTKPIRQSDLFGVLMRLLPAEPSPPTVAPAPSTTGPETAGKTYAILLAEDNAVNQKVVTRMLEKHGHRVTVAGDGLQALAALARARFDLVLMDIQMPEMDGFEAVAAIRLGEQSTGSHQPVIALTAHAMKGDRDRCLAAGFDSYVPKPIRSEELLAAIDEILDPDPTGPSEGYPSAADGAVAFDRERAMESTGGDESLLREVLALFFDDCPRQIELIEAAIEADDAPSMRRAAHTIKGAASNFAATRVVAASARLEAIAETGSCSLAGGDLASLVAALGHFFQALGDLAPSVAPWQTASAGSCTGPIHDGD
jgi:CheY-like chemotaxis protein/HPt (histidine-containing phosphotransfer) domain-containing protein